MAWNSWQSSCSSLLIAPVSLYWLLLGFFLIIKRSLILAKLKQIVLALATVVLLSCSQNPCLYQECENIHLCVLSGTCYFSLTVWSITSFVLTSFVWSEMRSKYMPSSGCCDPTIQSNKTKLQRLSLLLWLAHWSGVDWQSGRLPWHLFWLPMVTGRATARQGSIQGLLHRWPKAPLCWLFSCLRASGLIPHDECVPPHCTIILATAYSLHFHVAI